MTEDEKKLLAFAYSGNIAELKKLIKKGVNVKIKNNLINLYFIRSLSLSSLPFKH